MFKSIQWKVLTVLVLLILSVMLVVGTFLLNNISSYYHQEFKTQMETMVFTNDFVKQLNAAGADADAVYKMRSLFDVYSGRVGIDSFRNYYILDGKTADVLYASDKKSSGELQITGNLLNAMSGEVGNTIDRRASIMDFAYPVGGYIAYITDTKAELYLLGNENWKSKNPKIKILPPVPVKEMMKMIEKSLFGVLPLQWFNYSFGQMTMMQQMALGKAVIVSRVPSLMDYVQEGVDALTYPPENAEILAEQMQLLLDNESKRESLGKEAAKTIREKNNEKIMALEIEKFIGKIYKL